MYHVNSSQCHVSELNTHEMTSVEDLHFLATWHHIILHETEEYVPRHKVCACNVICKLLTHHTRLFHVII